MTFNLNNTRRRKLGLFEYKKLHQNSYDKIITADEMCDVYLIIK